MKHISFFVFFFLLFGITVRAQMNVGSNTAPDSSAMLQVSGNTKGFLPPRMSRDTMLLIHNPATGLIVFNTTDSALFMRRDSGWVKLFAEGSVTSASVVSANGLSGSVANSTTTPAITLSTTVTGIVKGNGTALSAATASDFPMLNQNTTGTASNITGVLNATSLPALTGDVTSAAGSAATTISNSAVTNAKMANMAANTFKANNTGSPAAPTDITATQATAMLDVFTSTAKGLAPASGGGTANFLRADGTFAVPPGTNTNSGTVTSVSVTSANGVSGTVATSTTTPAVSLTLGDITPTSVAATGTVTGSNLSGTNTGDETNATIKTKLGAATTTNDGYLTATDWNTFNNKASTTNSWSTTGNAGTSSVTSFLGTTDNVSLRFKTNNRQRMIMDSLGNVAIGTAPIFTASPNTERFLVDAGSTSANPSTSYNVINGKGYIDNYLQLNIQNNSPTASASSDVVASNDAATETTNFIDMGINSSGNTSTGAIGGAGTAYLYSTGNDLAIGNGTANKSIIFFTGGTTPATYTERIRLDANGRMGIGTSTPSSDLAVFQSSGSGNSKGITLTGNSIGGSNSGTGFLMSLGFNSTGNKQLWLGDADYAGNGAGTFIRFEGGSGTVLPTFNAVAGDNGMRRYIALGVGGDNNSGVMFGNDGSKTNPGSYVWDNGNMTIGSGYRANAAPSNGLLVQGNVGIGTISPSEKLDVTGNVKFSGALMPNNTAGTAGQVLTSAGANTPPTWSAAGTVTGVTVNSANGFAGTSNGSATAPVLTIQTTVASTKMIRSNGTGLVAATSGSDYAPGTAGNTTGIVKSTTGTGALTTATASDFPTLNQNTTGNAATVTTNANMTGDVTSVGNATTIASGVVTNAKLATMAANTFKANNTGATANATDITATQATAMLDVFTSTAKGLVPASGGGTTNFLRADGTFAAPTVTSPSSWSLTGNSGTSSSANFLGTTDAQPLLLKVNNQQIGRLELNSFAFGAGAGVNTATNSMALGYGATLGSGVTNAMALGSAANAGISNTFVIGNSAASSNAGNSFAIGNSATVASTNSFVIGSGASTAASITDAFAIGSSAIVNGSNSLAIGKSASTGTGATSAVAIGNGVQANATGSVSIGAAATAVGTGSTNSIAIGTGASIGSSLTNSTAIGANASTTFSNTMILGDRSNQLLSVGIGSEAFSPSTREKLLVDGGTVASDGYISVIGAKGSTNNYMQVNLQNRSNGSIASTDIVATNDAGTELNQTGFIDMGINSSGNTSTGVLGGNSTAYLYSTGNDFSIGNSTASKSLSFFTTDATNPSAERMRIDGLGNVGIGTNAPSTKLHIVGANPLTLLGVAAGTSTTADSLLTITSGLVRKIPITTFQAGTAISSLNGLTATTQTFATGTAGTDFNISSSASTHTFNIPDASATARGLVTTGAQTMAGSKTFSSAPTFSSLTAGSVPYIGTDGLVSQSNANLFWDATNSRLGIGTSTPSQKLDVNGTIVASGTTYPNYAYNSANRIAFGETNVPGNETGSVVQYGSGSNTRNMIFAFTKTLVNTSFLGNDGSSMILGTESTAPIVFRTGLNYGAANILGSGSEAMRITSGNKVGIGVTGPTALLNLAAGTAAANTAPLKLTSGTNMSTPEAGAVEFDGTNYFATSGTTRYTLAKTLTNTASLDFPNTSSGSVSTLTITVTGARDGDAVALGVPGNSGGLVGTFSAYVSANDTVTVKFSNTSTSNGIDPVPGTFRVSILKY